MKILINTTREMIEIGDTLFIPGEWVHVESDFVIPEYLDGDESQIFPIKTPQEIIDEHLTSVTRDTSLEAIQTIVAEQNINGFVRGILEAGYGS